MVLTDSTSNGLPRPGFRPPSYSAGAAPKRLSLLTADTDDTDNHNHPSPSLPKFDVRPEPQHTTPIHKEPKTSHTPQKRHLTITLVTTLLFQTGALVLALLLLIAGTGTAPFTNNKSSNAAILLQDFYILDIPIKYPFLCPEGQALEECEPRWSVKLYLDGVWAFEDVQGDYEPIHHLRKGMGDIFNLTDALTIMDTTIDMKGQGSWSSNRSYTVPTEPTLNIRAMTPLALRLPIILLIAGMSLSSPLLIIWIWESCASTRNAARAKWIRREWILFLMSTMFACFLAAAVYIQITASRARDQVLENALYVSGPHKQPSFGGTLQGVMFGTVGLQAVTLIAFGIYAWLERRTMERTEAEKSVEEGFLEPHKRTNSKGVVNTDVAAAGDGSMTPTDLDMIRMAELMTLREIHSRRSSISEISQISRLSRTYSHT